MSYHYSPLPVSGFSGSVVLWSKSTARRALVFVHGFGGQAIGTWEHFPTLLARSGEFSDFDIYFYSYDSFLKGVIVNSALIGEFLDIVCRCRSELLNDSLGGDLGDVDVPNYDSLIVLSHSMGSVITRAAILDAIQERRSWVVTTKHIMFAPAHSGVYPIPFWQKCMTYVPRLLGIPSKGHWSLRIPALFDLQPESAVLRFLKLHCEALAARPEGRALKPAVLVNAGIESVVFQIHYSCDPKPTLAETRNHIDVCKPDLEYDLPLKLLTEAI